MLVGKRRRLLDYLIKVDIERYRAIIKEAWYQKIRNYFAGSYKGQLSQGLSFFLLSKPLMVK